MKDILLGAGTGLIVGAIFGAVKAQPPAPGTLGGVLGVVGIWAGWVIVTWWRTR